MAEPVQTPSLSQIGAPYRLMSPRTRSVFVLVAVAAHIAVLLVVLHLDKRILPPLRPLLVMVKVLPAEPSQPHGRAEAR